MKAIILAAGEGKRMKSETPKVLHKILEKPMLHYVIDTAKLAGVQESCVILGHKKEEIEKSLDGSVVVVEQKEQLGTGHAVMQAGDFISDNDNILILCGDTPLIKPETLKELIAHHEKNDSDITVVSAILEDPKGYGRIVNKNGKVLIVEHRDATEEERKVKEINTGLMCFKGKALKSALDKLQNNNDQKEYYLTDTLEIIQNDGGKANIFLASDANDFLGINTIVQLHEASIVMRTRINTNHMLNGVNIIDSNTTFISDTVEIGQDTVIYPNCIIKGKTKIGRNCTIGMSCNLTDMQIDDQVDILSSTAVSSIIGKGSHVGPYAYIRPGTVVGENVKVGDFVELKNADIGNNTKISHLSYVGDAKVGSNVNIGCGTITVNYDGVNKFTTNIGDGAFVGCNSNLVAPVNIGKDAYIACGSTITLEVPDSGFAIARERQTNKLGWSKK